MSKTAVIYWTGTGNTEAMANAIAAGIGEADVLSVLEADASAVAQYEKIAFGCPAMGDEVLEEGEFEPFFAEVEGSLSGKKDVYKRQSHRYRICRTTHRNTGRPDSAKYARNSNCTA